jgi:glucose/arabinose dehydrogenase
MDRVLLTAVLVAMSAAAASAQAPQRVASQKASFIVETVARGLQNPWGLAFLPDGRMLVTEKPGRLRVVAADGKLSEPLAGLPRVEARSQGGLLDVAIDPQFAQNRQIYLSFTEPRESGNGTSVARARLSDDATALEQMRVIWRQEPSYGNAMHFGSRIVFARDGHMFVTVGDRYALRNEAQNPANTLGKVVRITRDGKPAPGNPGLSGKDWNPFIWSIGHRNVQGAALHPATGQLWTAEHGARGGDEINRPEAGRNYGWPVITYGIDYSGAKIGVGTHRDGMEQPVFYWDPSIAPSGMTFYTGDAFPAWKGNAFVGGLALQLLARLEFDGDRIVREERLLRDLGERIRDVRQGPDGLIYLLTDSAQGRVLRLKPAG